MWRVTLAATVFCVGGVAASPVSFQKGADDRSTYESWFSGLSGDFQVGASFWAAHRNIPGQATCFTNNAPPLTSLWMQGCLEAQRQLMASDAARRSDPDYRTGWNSYRPGSATVALQASPAPVRGTVAMSTNVSQAIAACRSQTSAVVRLDCYDKVSNSGVADAESPNPKETAAPATPTSTALGVSDFSAIVSASRDNELRFARDYEGKNFRSSGEFLKVAEGFMSSAYRVSVQTDGGEVDCSISDQEKLREIVDWHKGQKVTIFGQVSSTIMGDLILSSPCDVTSP